MKVNEKSVEWVGSSLTELRKFPEDVKDVMGYSLSIAQDGGKADNAKPLTNIVKGGLIYEICDNDKGDTYRAVYTVKFKDVLYVLHTFKKKSKKGIATPKPDIDLIKARYAIAEQHYKDNYGRK